MIRLLYSISLLFSKSQFSFLGSNCWCSSVLVSTYWSPVLVRWCISAVLHKRPHLKICSLLVGRKGSYLLHVEDTGMFRLEKSHFQKEAAGEAGTHGRITKPRVLTAVWVWILCWWGGNQTDASPSQQPTSEDASRCKILQHLPDAPPSPCPAQPGWRADISFCQPKGFLPQSL